MIYKVIVEDIFGNKQQIGEINDSMLIKTKVWINKFGKYLPEKSKDGNSVKEKK